MDLLGAVCMDIARTSERQAREFDRNNARQTPDNLSHVPHQAEFGSRRRFPFGRPRAAPAIHCENYIRDGLLGQAMRERENVKPFQRYGRLAIVMLTGVVGLEAFCRFGLGLGDPPLVLPDPMCGYRFAPSQSIRRFGNTVSFDDRSMRGSRTSEATGKVWQVLIIGDSVLNGGAVTDDADTADGVLNGLAVTVGDRPAVFRNLSAGSWAPPQQLAYLRAYGAGAANAVVLVLSSHDAVGKHHGETPPFPSRKPWLAAEELFFRYFLGQRRHVMDSGEGWEAKAANVPTEISMSSAPTAVSSWCLAQICDWCKERELPLAVVLWPTRSEAEADAWDPLYQAITTVLAQHNVSWVDLLPGVRQQPDFATRLYRDDIHPTDAGQRIVAGGVLRSIQRLDLR